MLPRMLKRIAMAVAALLVPAAILTAALAHAAPVPARLVALRWAETRAGAPYVWGGSGPGFDCSGLVMAAYARAGISLPHNTVAMLRSGRLHWEPRQAAHWGDVIMWGGSQPFHTELDFGYNGLRTFGAHSQGSAVGVAWQGGSWYAGESFYRVY
jgi:hypothetical protein